uniref:Uncharacterized protein n=1 Tax=Anguilla anguilla TaxID=7936 RepID=A0A0E9V2A4_ANGAN
MAPFSYLKKLAFAVSEKDRFSKLVGPV